MSKEELNALRPHDRIVDTTARVRTIGVVYSVWRDSHFTVRWGNSKQPDVIEITPNGDPSISLYRPN